MLQGHSAMDIESLESQNDASIAALEDRVGLLRNVSLFPFFVFSWFSLPFLNVRFLFCLYLA